MAKKKIGSKYWADSFVRLKNGTIIYLEEFFWDLDRKMNSKKDTIKVEISNKDENIVIRKIFNTMEQ